MKRIACLLASLATPMAAAQDNSTQPASGAYSPGLWLALTAAALVLLIGAFVYIARKQ